MCRWRGRRDRVSRRGRRRIKSMWRGSRGRGKRLGLGLERVMMGWKMRKVEEQERGSVRREEEATTKIRETIVRRTTLTRLTTLYLLSTLMVVSSRSTLLQWAVPLLLRFLRLLRRSRWSVLRHVRSNTSHAFLPSSLRWKSVQLRWIRFGRIIGRRRRRRT